jgi:hypothetical protein
MSLRCPDPDGQVMLHVVPSSVPSDLIVVGGGLVPAAAAVDLVAPIRVRADRRYANYMQCSRR